MGLPVRRHLPRAVTVLARPRQPGPELHLLWLAGGAPRAVGASPPPLLLHHWPVRQLLSLLAGVRNHSEFAGLSEGARSSAARAAAAAEPAAGPASSAGGPGGAGERGAAVSTDSASTPECGGRVTRVQHTQACPLRIHIPAAWPRGSGSHSTAHCGRPRAVHPNCPAKRGLACDRRCSVRAALIAMASTAGG